METNFTKLVLITISIISTALLTKFLINCNKEATKNKTFIINKIIEPKDTYLQKFINSGGDNIDTESDNDEEKKEERILIKNKKREEWYKEGESAFNRNQVADIIKEKSPPTIWGVIKKKFSIFYQ